MTHKERLLTAINHEEPDRVPLCAWYTPEAEKTVLRHLGVESNQTETYKAAGGPLPILMDHDFLISWVGPCTGYYADPAEEYTDEWGIGWKWFKYAASGSYTEMVRRPLADIVDPADFSMPDFTREDRYTGACRLVAEYGNEYGIMGGCACTLFELSWYLRGMEKVLEDMVANKDFMHAYLDRLMTWIDEAGTRMVGLGVDIIWIGDDFGMQDGMIISPQLFREFFKPRYAYLFCQVEGDQSQREDCVSLRWQHLPDHSRSHRSRAGYPQSGAAQVDGSGRVKKDVRRQAHLVGDGGYSGSSALRHARGCGQRGQTARANRGQGRRADHLPRSQYPVRGAAGKHPVLLRVGEEVRPVPSNWQLMRRWGSPPPKTFKGAGLGLDTG